ncbi:MAG: alpha/beta hydrolase [Candidatus Heimdallarchaeota archaeon]
MNYESQFIKETKDRIKNLQRQGQPNKIPSMVSEFWNTVQSSDYPIIERLEDANIANNNTEYNFVTFLYRTSKNVDNVFLLAEFNFIDPKDYLFEHIDGTDIFYKTFLLPKGAQAEYRIFENDPLDGIFAGAKYQNRLERFHEHPDKLSRHIRRIPNGYLGKKDLFIASLRPFPPEISNFVNNKNQQKGEISTYEQESDILGCSRKISLYTPADYNAEAAYKFIFIHDGSAALSYGETHTLIDYLIASKAISPVVGIFTDPGVKNGNTTRNEEYPCNPHYARSIVQEILPWVRENVSISSDPNDGIIAGSSYGGLASFYYSFMYPESIANVLSLSGSFHWGRPDEDYPYEWLPRKIAFSEKKAIKAYLEVGKLEGEYHWNSPGFPNQIVSHRHFVTILRMKGYSYEYNEYNGDHSPTSWIKPLERGLRYFLGKRT